MFKIAILNDFAYYIHPRYIVFSVIATFVFFVVVIKTWQYMGEIHYHQEKRSGLLSFLIVFTLILAIALPAKGLTSTTAQKRFNSGNQAVILKKEIKNPTEVSEAIGVVEGSNSDVRDVDAASPSPFMVTPRSDDPGDIFSNLVFNIVNSESLGSFEGVEVELVGFVLIDRTDRISPYHVSRFFIACCTADANPIAIPFEYSGHEYMDDDWVKVTGRLRIVSDDKYEKVMIIPSAIERVPEPEFPYAYY
jgi:uncharacterized repeat protein (TIGR03943 family)